MLFFLFYEFRCINVIYMHTFHAELFWFFDVFLSRAEYRIFLAHTINISPNVPADALALSRPQGISRHSIDCVRLRDAHNTYRSHCYLLQNYSDVIMSVMASQITGVVVVYSTVCSGVDQRKHQSSAPLAFVRGIHRWLVNSPHKGPVMRKMFPFDYVIV